MQGKTVLITGAGGFIGRQTRAPLEAAGFAVKAFEGDIFSPENVKRNLGSRPTHLLHTAWYTAHGKFWNAPENEDWRKSSLALFESFAAQGGERILALGSCAEYDWGREDAALWKEEDPCRPHTAYGQAKLALMEDLMALGISACWARLFLLFGKGEKPERLVPSVLRAAQAGEEAACRAGNHVRDFMAAPLCGRALAHLLASEAAGAVNVGSGRAASVAEIVSRLCALAGNPGGYRTEFSDEKPAVMVPNLAKLRAAGFAEVQDTEKELAALLP